MSPRRTAKKRTWFPGKSDEEIREQVKKFRKLDEWLEKNKKIPLEEWKLKLTKKDVEKALSEFKALDEAIEKSLRPSQEIDWKKWLEKPENRKKLEQLRKLRRRIKESLKKRRTI